MVKLIFLIFSFSFNLLTRSINSISVGHPPFGRLGEKVLDIEHAQNGAVIMQEVEKNGAGLNLNWETVNAILLHPRNNAALRLNKNDPNEINVLVLADKIAYTFSDIIDFQKMKMLEEKNLPEEMSELVKYPDKKDEIISSCVNAIVKESMEKERVSFSESAEAKSFMNIRTWMHEVMYKSLNETETIKIMEEKLKAVLEYISHTDLCGNLDPRFVVSMMTDREVYSLADLLERGTHKIKNGGLMDTQHEKI